MFHELVTFIKNPVTIKFLGGTGEVGRSAVAVKGDRTQLLVDYGIMTDHEPGFPMHIPPNEVDGIVLTHSHLDHSGAIPIFHIGGETPVFGTQLSFELTKLLILDLIHLSGYYLPFEYLDLETMMDSCVNVDYREPRKIGDVTIELLESGHIPGGAQVILASSGKRVLYTSDFNTADTGLLRGADQDYGEIDVLIMESTYANEDHMDRKTVEQKFVSRVIEVVERGGTVLVPAFSVGRSQEILCVLKAYNFKHPVAVDGMAKEANNILMRYPNYLRDAGLLIDALNSANWIKGWRDRRLAAKKPGVIVSPAGMLKGGNAVFYMNNVARKIENAIFLVSYQIPNSPGRRLLDTGKFIIRGKTVDVKAEVENFDFTSHCGRTQLIETAKLVDGGAHVFLMHGAEENCQSLANYIKSELGLEAVAPKAGDVFKV
jgi:putative mRNA 3-end processing factor